MALTVVNSSVLQVSSGALTDDGFTVQCDMSHDVQSRLIVSLAADTQFANPVLRTEIKPASLTDKLGGGSWFSSKHVASGLLANTSYRYAIESNGSVRPNSTGTLKTAPAEGVAAAFRFSFGSCYSQVYAGGDQAMTGILNDDPLFFALIGDKGYDDYVGTDIKTKRGSMHRLWRGVSTANTLCRAVPQVFMFDDHDGCDNDGQWDKSYSGTTFAEILARTRQVYRETFPHYDFVDQGDDPIPLQVFTIANTRHILLDTRSQRRFSVGTPTMLGRTSGHELFNQFDAVVSAVQQAADDGVGLIFLYTPTDWSTTSYDGWRTQVGWQAEQKALLDAFKSNPGLPKIVVLAGNIHAMAADDGGNTDYSTGGGMKIVQFVSSGLRQQPLSGVGTYTWQSVNTKLTTGDRKYINIDVNAANNNVVATIKSSSFGLPVTVATYDTSTLTGWA